MSKHKRQPYKGTPKIELDDIQKSIIDRVENTNDNLFITGKAGTGKSVIIKELIRRSYDGTSDKVVVPLAFTGIAALNVGAQTINSFFKIYSEGVYDYKKIVYDANLDPNILASIIKVDTFIIDEISMVRSDLFKTIDELCRKATNEPDKLFGGIQLIMFGDLYQLPPVIKEPEVVDAYDKNRDFSSKTPIKDYIAKNFGGIYFFNCPDVLENISVIELNKVYRQADLDFVNMLNDIRVGENLQEALNLLNTRVIEPKDDLDYITLCTTNDDAEVINELKLKALDTELIEHEGVIEGRINKSELPTSLNLQLKVGAHVMTIVNGIDYRNGSIGVIKDIDLEHEILTIKLTGANGKYINIRPYEWEKVVYKYDKLWNRYKPDVVGTFKQWPIKLAWAVTVHKSQGQTFDSVYIKPGNMFCHGQAYVALSRCRSLKTLYLHREFTLDDITVSSKVDTFMNTVKIERFGNEE